MPWLLSSHEEGYDSSVDAHLSSVPSVIGLKGTDRKEGSSNPPNEPVAESKLRTSFNVLFFFFCGKIFRVEQSNKFQVL